MDFKFYSVPQSNSKVNEISSFKSSDLQEVISRATKDHLRDHTPYDVYLVIELSYNFSKQSSIFKKLFTINEKSLIPCISPDNDFVDLVKL